MEWELDARTHLRLVLDLVDAGLPVRYNLDDLQGYELLTPRIASTIACTPTRKLEGAR